MTGPRVESEPERRARIQGNLQRLKAAGAPPERIQAYLETERITPEMEAERTPLSALETAGGALGSALQGATFSLADEIGGTVGGIGSGVVNLAKGKPANFGAEIGAGIDEQRQQTGQFREAHPLASLGLELGGGLATGLGAARLAGAGASGLTMAQRAARVAASGAGGGAAAGYGSGEGGPLSGSRLGRGAVGGLAGAAIGAAAPAVAKGWQTSVAGSPQAPVDLLETIAGRASSPFAAPVAGRVGDVLPADVSRGTPTGFSPAGVSAAAQQAAKRSIGDTGNARDLLSQLEAGGMGDEALTMNVGGDRAVRAVRAAANTPMSDAGQMVNERLARQGGALGEQVPGDIGKVTGFGTDFPEVSARNMQRDLSAKVEEGYNTFRQRGNLLPPPPPPPAPTVEWSESGESFFPNASRGGHGGHGGGAAVDLSRLTTLLGDRKTAAAFWPFVESAMDDVELRGLPDTDARVIDAAVKKLQRQYRMADIGERAGVGKDVTKIDALDHLRQRVLGAIGEVDPNYAALGRTYALDEDVGKVIQEGFETGRSIKTPGQATVAMDEAARVPGAQKAIRAGNVATLQSAARRGASNVDLGDLAQFRDVARAVVGTPEARETFIALHGKETYDALLERLMPKIRAAAQNAAARGNSTTTKQLLDALAFGDDAALDALGALTTGGATGVIRNMVGRAVQPADRALRLGIGRTATETADLLTTKGAPKIRNLLDLLDQLGIESEAAKQTARPLAGAVSGRVTRRER